jgi:hypothetical protein
MSDDLPIPPQARERIKQFLTDNKTGNITLDIRSGQIRAWSLTEFGSPRGPNPGPKP